MHVFKDRAIIKVLVDLVSTISLQTPIVENV